MQNYYTYKNINYNKQANCSRKTTRLALKEKAYMKSERVKCIQNYQGYPKFILSQGSKKMINKYPIMDNILTASVIYLGKNG